MIHNILFDDKKWNAFLPLTYTRSISDLRCGILTIYEKWNHYFASPCQVLTEEYLQPIYSLDKNVNDYLFINARFLPNPDFITELQSLDIDEVLTFEQTIVAVRSNHFINPNDITIHTFNEKKLKSDTKILHYYWDLFKLNHSEITQDFTLLTKDKQSAPIPAHVQAMHPENIFIEEGAELDFCILNAKHGYIYIGKNAHIMDGAMIRGSAAICENAVIKMGAKIYEHTTIGPYCKVGGEVSNVIFHSYSNKGHDGYLGNALIGAWCNLGADTNCSNLKNDYGSVQVWSEAENKKINTGEQFVGLMMGDHSKCAINTMFNTGTIVGVSCNVFGAGFPPTFIPSFSWGWSEKMISYRFDKAIDANLRMMERRKKSLSEDEREILKNVYNFAQNHRK